MLIPYQKTDAFLLTLDDREAHQLSCQVEPPPANTP